MRGKSILNFETHHVCHEADFNQIAFITCPIISTWTRSKQRYSESPELGVDSEMMSKVPVSLGCIPFPRSHVQWLRNIGPLGESRRKADGRKSTEPCGIIKVSLRIPQPVCESAEVRICVRGGSPLPAQGWVFFSVCFTGQGGS